MNRLHAAELNENKTQLILLSTMQQLAKFTVADYVSHRVWFQTHKSCMALYLDLQVTAVSPTVFLRDASIVLWRFLGTNASHAFNADWITATFRNSLDEMATPVSGEYYDSACVVGARRRDHNSTGFCSGSVAPTRLQEPDVRRKMFGAVHLSWLWYRPTSTGCIIGLQLPRVHEYRIPHTVANNIQNMCPTLQQLISEHVETEV